MSPQVLSLLLFYPNVPDEPPKTCFPVPYMSCTSCASLPRGFVGSPTCDLGSLYLDTLSVRDMGCSMPHRFAYCNSLGDSGLVPPQVSTLPSSFASHCLRSRVRSLTNSSQQSPVPWLRLAPLATPRCFPIQTKGMSSSLTCLFGVHDWTTVI